MADWANKPRVDQTTICPLVLPQPTLLLILCKCLNQPSFYSSLKPPVCKAFDGVGGAGSEILQFFWGCTMTKMSQQIQRQYCRQCNARNVEAQNAKWTALIKVYPGYKSKSSHFSILALVASPPSQSLPSLPSLINCPLRTFQFKVDR